jgi:hypothetical protein
MASRSAWVWSAKRQNERNVADRRDVIGAKGRSEALVA